MSAHASLLKLRMFLEGVEVPIIGIQIQGLPNAPLLGAIQVPPVPEGTRLLPRTLVHVFFLDPYEEESPFLSSKRAASSAPTNVQDPSSYQDNLSKRNAFDEGFDEATRAVEADLTSYKLLFVGEVLGFEWTKDAAQRALVLQCADLSNYWDYAYQWTNTGLFGPGIKALFSGGSTNLFTDFLSSSAEVITNILRTPSISFPNLKGLGGGIIHLLESIGGSYYYDKKIAGQNIFFTLAELRLHINQMIVAVEDDPTASRLLAVQGYGGLLNRLLGGMGGQTSIRQSITALQGIIFHETYAQPCPKYIPGAYAVSNGESKRVRLDQRPDTRFITNAALGVVAALKDIKLQLHVADNRPDVSAFSQIGSVTASLREQIIIKFRKQQQLLKSTTMQLSGVKPAVPVVNSRLAVSAQKLGGAAALMRTWNPVNDASIADVERLVDDVIGRLQELANTTVLDASRIGKTPPRLVQQILRPDVWFSAPPRCNVIFPEHYSRLQYKRSFMEEPTRLLLKTNDEFFGEDELFDRFYFAPKTKSVKKSKADLQALLKGDLLEHELFTGILPVFEKMGELNIFAARGGVVKDRVPQVGLAQRSANFLYFKYRFAARQMVVSGRFNPYLALGFPTLVIDKYVDANVLALHNELLQKIGQPTRDINKLLGTSFLGNATQVTIQLNQQSGTMDVVLSYPRQPEERVEFLGATHTDEVTVNKRFDTDAVRATDVATIDMPKVQAQGPNLGRITKVQEVTGLYSGASNASTSAEATSSKPLLLFSNSRPGTKPRTAAQRVRARVPVGIEVDARLLDRNVIKELGLIADDVSNRFSDDDFIGQDKLFDDGRRSTVAERQQGTRQEKFYAQPRPITIRVFRIEEEVPRFRQEVVDLPAEEYIRPGWYGDIWHPAKIGSAYDLFFSTGAITDPHTINDATGQQFAGTSNQAAAAGADAAKTDDGRDPSKDAPLVYQLQAGASIEQAAAFLQATYSHIKLAGLDVEEFIRAYTWRPIATMVDIFGTRDLQLSPNGNFVMQGIEGFHSRAFGDFSNLFGLVTPEIEDVVGVKRGTTAAQRGDTRKVKRDAVLDYLAGLGLGRAVIG